MNAQTITHMLGGSDTENCRMRQSPCAQETSDCYSGIVAQLSDDVRVVECRDRIQWIVQRRKKGGAARPWRGIAYCVTRNALMRVCASLEGRNDPAALATLAALPDRIGGPT